MKRTAIVLASALVLALAAPATFAASIDISGQAETLFEFGQDQNTMEWGLTGKTGLKLSPTLHVNDNIELGVEFNTYNDGMTKDGPTTGFGDQRELLTPGVVNAWLKATGPYWHGGPSVTTTVGDQTVNWNEWVADLGATRAITVEGIGLGIADADVFYVWADDAADRPMGMRIHSEYEGIEWNGTLLRKANQLNAALGAATDFNGIHVDGVAALDSAYRYAFKMNASVNPAEDITLHAGYRQMQDGFAPMHAKLDDTNTHIVPFHEDSNDAGFNVGVETVQYGFTLGATYDQPTDQASVTAARTFDVSDHAIATQYAATFNPGGQMKHELSASTTTDAIPYVPGLGLSAEVAHDGADFTYAVDSSYTAPNGVNFGAGYDSVAGPVVSAGLKVQF